MQRAGFGQAAVICDDPLNLNYLLHMLKWALIFLVVAIIAGVFGFTYWPDPDVAVKFDYSAIRNQSRVNRALNSFNIGLGWWF